MITETEIAEKAEEFDLHPSNVQRDYVFGWIISGLYQTSSLASTLVLKGGNALRKGYLPETRFSDDLDFTTAQGIDGARLLRELNSVCQFAEERSGVRFDYTRNQLVDVQSIDRRRNVYKLRLYFRDLRPDADYLTLKVRVDVTEFDRLYLPVQTRRLIHPYSDGEFCIVDIRCVKLEEALADKLKCLLQRRYSHDLFDLVHGMFLRPNPAIDHRQIVLTFLKKTIFEPSPVAALDLLLATPLELMRGFWQRILSPRASRLSFDDATQLFRDGLSSLFAPFGYGRERQLAYYPAEMRNLILSAGADQTLMRLTYEGFTRTVEPYSLLFKRRDDGVAQEYFYAWDRTGGRSGPGIKALFNYKVRNLENTEERFDPRYDIDLRNAGATVGSFAAQRRGRY